MITIPTVQFTYSIPASIELSMPMIRKTLREVQAQLLRRDINGGDKKLRMETTTCPNRCGMAACLGGWTSLFLLGFDVSRDTRLEHAADELFSTLITVDRLYGRGYLSSLFHDYHFTLRFNEPNVAATAIKRYLAGKENPWPCGEMPNVMPYTYTKRAARKH